MTIEKDSADEKPPTHRVYEIIDDAELSLEEKQRRVLAIGREYLGVTNGHIQRHPSDSTTDEILVSVGGDSELLPEGTTLDRSKTYCRHTVQEPSPVAVSNASEQGWQNDPAYNEHDIDCYLGTTMFVRGEVYGTVCFIQRTPREDGFTADEKMFIELVARLLGRSIEATQLEQRTEEKEALQKELEKTTKGTLQLASELEERYQRLFETAVEGIYTTTDTLDEYAMANPAFADLLGYESGEELCTAVDSIEDDVFVDADTYATYSETLRSVGELDQFEYPVRTTTGEIRWVSDSVTALTNDEGEIDGYRGGVIDITEQKKREQDLIRQQKLNTVLLRIFRHNLRNEFTIIRGYTTRMADQLDDDSMDGDVVTSAIDRVLSLAEKSTELDAFLMEGADRKTFDIMTLIRKAIRDIEADYPDASVGVTGPDYLPVRMYPNFSAALRELIENACKHAEDAPTVTVSVEEVQEMVEIEVFDNGPGLPKQESTVLETGTEEPLTHGKGLGLWMVYWIVTGHDGAIDTTVSEAGTRITITLPLSAVGTDSTSETVSITQQFEDIFQAVFEETADTLVVADDNGRTLRVNESAADLIGLPKQEILGRSFDEFTIDSFDFDTFWTSLQGSGQQQTITPLVRPDGTERIIECTATGDIVPGLHLIVCQDITERKEYEQELELAETVVQNTQDALFLIDVGDDHAFRIQRVNERYEDVMGVPSDEITGKTPREVVGDEVGSEIESRYRECVERRETIRYVEEVPVDGESRVWETKLTPLIEDGSVKQLIGATRDITEHRERERELAEKNRQLEAIVQNTSDAIYIKDTDGSYQFINESGAELFDLSVEEVIGKHDADLFDAESVADIRAVDEQIIESGEGISEEAVRFLDGEKHVFLDDKYPYRNEDGEIIGIMGISLEISERKRHVRELERQNERLDDFASVVSHDLRNPLNVAQGRLQLANEECESEHLDDIKHAHERMETLIDSLLALARAGQTIDDLEPITLAALSDDCWQNVETADGEISIATERVIQADRSRLKQLLENVFRNAIEHGGEDVTVTIGDLASDQGFYIEDDGSGVPEGERDQLFEPGYTTNRGTGLGLNIVKQIAGAHGWEVGVSAGGEGGTRFEFTGVEYTDKSHSSSKEADGKQDTDSEQSTGR